MILTRNQSSPRSRPDGCRILTGRDFRQISSVGSKLENCKLERISLTLSGLLELILIDSVVAESQFQQCDLTDSAMSGSKIDSSRFSRCDFSNSLMSQCTLRNSVVSQSLVEGYSADRVSFLETDLQHLLVYSSNFDHCSFEGTATLHSIEAVWNSFKDLSFTDASIDSSSFGDCVFSNVDADSLRCVDSKFDSTRFVSGQFRASDFQNTLFGDCVVERVLFQDVSFTDVFFTGTRFRNVHFENCRFVDVKWDLASLDGCSFDPDCKFAGDVTDRVGLVNTVSPWQDQDDTALS